MQQFVIANNRQSFNSTHGIIETRHFSMWTILRQLRSIVCVSSRPLPTEGATQKFPAPYEEIIVFPYYQVRSICIKVNLVILKRLKVHNY